MKKSVLILVSLAVHLNPKSIIMRGILLSFENRENCLLASAWSE